MSTVPAAHVGHCFRAQPWPVPLGLHRQPSPCSLHQSLPLPLAPCSSPVACSHSSRPWFLYPNPGNHHTAFRITPSFLAWHSRPLDLAQLTLQGLPDFICKTGPLPPALPWSYAPPLSPQSCRGAYVGTEGKTGHRSCPRYLRRRRKAPVALSLMFLHPAAQSGRSWLIRGSSPSKSPASSPGAPTLSQP